MANTIKLAHNATSGKTPTDLASGEVAINSANKKIWVGTNGTTAGQVLLFDHSIYSTDLSDNDTTYTAGGGLSLSGTVFSHSDTSSQGSIDGTGRQYIQDVTLDTYGHVTGLGVATETVTNTNTTYSAGSGLNLSGTTFSHSDTSSQGSINLSGRSYIQDLTLDAYGHVTGYGYGTETITDSDTNTTYSAGTALTLSGTTFSLTNSTQYLKKLSAGSAANLDTYTDNGFRSVSHTGHSKLLLSMNAGGSTGTFQLENHYNGQCRVRNKVDSSTWADWEYLVSTTTGQTAISGTILHTGNLTAGGGLTRSSTTISHSDTSSQGSINLSGRSYIQDLTLDTYGHVTGYGYGTETVTNTNTTYTAGTGLSLSGTTFNMTAAGNGVRGGVKLGYPESGQFYPVEAHGTTERLYVNVPWQNTTYVVQDGGLTQKNFTTTLKNKLDGITGYNYSAGTGLTLSGSTFSLSTPTVLASAGSYVWSQSTTAGNYTTGLQCSFVRSSDGWPSYGSVLHVGARGGTDAGGDFQIYCGHGSGSGGNYLRVRNADNNASPTDSWTDWRTIWDSGNVTAGTGISISGTTITNTVTNTNTTYSAGSGLSLSGTTFSHSDTSSQGSINLSGRQYIQDLTLDTYGHVTGYGYATETVTNTDTNTTYSAGTGLTLSGTTFKTDRTGTYVESEGATNLAVGWYTIAINSGNRAIGRFGLRDRAGSRHQSVIFYAAHHYGQDASNTITVLHNSRYNTSPFRYIRIKDHGTYDGAALQVYIDNSTNNINVYLLGDNFQDSSWYLRDWIADGTDPTGVSNYSSMTEKSKVDLDQIDQGGIVTTGPIYGFGDTTQYQLATQSWVNSQGFLTSETADIKGVTAGAGLSGGGTSGTPTLSHADTSSQGSINLSGRQYIQDLTLDTYGHVTGYGYATETVTNTDTNTTYSAGTGLNLSGTTFGLNESLGRNYIEMGNDTGSVSNDGSWNARFNVAGSSHARIDVYENDDGIKATMYAHTGHTGPRFGSMSNHPVNFMCNGTTRATLTTAGSLSTTVQGTLWGTSSKFTAGSNLSWSGSTLNATDTNTNTTYSAGSGLSLSGTTFSHSDTSSQGSINLSGRSYIQDLTLDTYGHVTGYAYATETVTNTDTNTWRPVEAGGNTLSGSETLEFKSGSGISISESGGEVTLTCTVTNTNTTYSAGSGLSLSGTTFSHADTSSQSSVDGSGRQYVQDITLDTYGHVTGIGVATETVTNTDTNTVREIYLNASSFLNNSSSGAAFDLRTSSPIHFSYSANGVAILAHENTAGNKHIPSGGSSNQYLIYSSSGTANWSTIAFSHLQNLSALNALP